MYELTKTRKRIVSKGEYVANTGKKAALASYGTTVFLTGIAASAITLFLIMRLLWNLRAVESTSGITLIVLLTGITGSASYALFCYGKKALKEGKDLDAGIPLTRANTGDLPAVDSLVRASQEPIEGQENFLLRAAQHGQGTPSEQMVRASAAPKAN